MPKLFGKLNSKLHVISIYFDVDIYAFIFVIIEELSENEI